MSIGRAVLAWELPLLKKAEKNGKGVAEITSLFNQYCAEFKAEFEGSKNKPKEKVELTKAEKTAITKAKNKAKKEADDEVERLKAEREAEEARLEKESKNG